MLQAASQDAYLTVKKDMISEPKYADSRLLQQSFPDVQAGHLLSAGVVGDDFF